MDIGSLVFRKAVQSRGLDRRLWSGLRRALIRLQQDPTCTMPIHGRAMKVNLSHGLPLYQAHHPFYDTLPRRLGGFLRRRHGALRCVDVGANIGDSIAAFIGGAEDRFLAIEPNPKFFGLLRANWGHSPQVTALPVLCSSGSESGAFTIREQNGTASIVEQADGARLQRRTLDDLIEEQHFAPVNLLKIDTDGHDFEVLEGGLRSIARDRPAVLFECDVFGRADYPQRVLSALDAFARCAYTRYLVYDNFGHLMGRYSLADPTAFKALLFYQLTSRFHYFDLLVMPEPDLCDFHAEETRFFAEQLAGPKRSAAQALAPGGAADDWRRA
ncbi:FkbM family methyltransferase [Aquabacterium sp.]|uniref:FkbM family methyltransferase n=1 Tax=Aquabacterium sp. TaxID=1872578 RepID=UPI0037841B16